MSEGYDLFMQHTDKQFTDVRHKCPQRRFILGASSLAMAFALFLPPLFAQEPHADSASATQAKPADTKTAPEANPPKEEFSSTDHTIRLGAQTVPYKATASTTLLKDDKDEPVASIFSIAYTRTDVKDSSQRPIAFIYNGGPGSASLWMHMGAFGPRRVVTQNAASTGSGPYQLVDNENCLLDKADLVFIDPVGTGFSRTVGKGDTKDYWGVDQDVKSFADFIGIFISRNGRWNSPKFLIGESYGTFRSVALANYLQSQRGIYINGIALVSTALDLTTLGFNLGDDRSYIFYVPSYAASAWYYKTLKNRPDDLGPFLADARHWAATDYAAALMKGDAIGDAEKSQIAKKLSDFTGLGEDYILKANLRVNLAQFEVELQRSRGITVGRYDSRYSGPTYDLLIENAQYDPSYDAVSGAFTAGINSYLRQDLKFSTALTYVTLSDEIEPKWDWKRKGADPGSVSVSNDLVQALITNPDLQVQFENGWFDMATPFFATEFLADHLLLPPALRSRLSFKYYDSGHMIYLNEQDLPKLKSNVADLIDATTKPRDTVNK
jgi:carboxypeptidase C (cathepsin A)